MSIAVIIMLVTPLFLSWGAGNPFLYSVEERCWKDAMALYESVRGEDREMGEALFLVLRDSASEYGNVCRALEVGREFLKRERERKAKQKQFYIAMATAISGVVFLAGIYRRGAILHPQLLSHKGSPG